jgi:hypothetical protein
MVKDYIRSKISYLCKIVSKVGNKAHFQPHWNQRCLLLNQISQKITHSGITLTKAHLTAEF